LITGAMEWAASPSLSDSGPGGQVEGSVSPAPSIITKDSAKPVFTMKRTGRTSLFSPAPVLTIPVGDKAAPEPEPAQVMSDIIASSAPPNSTAISTPLPAHKEVTEQASPQPSSASGSKYKTDAERKNALSLALKRRWASGSMKGAQAKRAETLKRRKLLGYPRVTKRSPSHFPNLSGIDAAPTRAPKSSLDPDSPRASFWNRMTPRTSTTSGTRGTSGNTATDQASATDTNIHESAVSSHARDDDQDETTPDFTMTEAIENNDEDWQEDYSTVPSQDQSQDMEADAESIDFNPILRVTASGRSYRTWNGKYGKHTT
jgi:hypothetical protein